MALLLCILTITLTVFSVACSIIFLWLNNFSIRSDISSRNKSVKGMMQITMIASMITALLTGLLSNAESIEASIQSTVTLYFIIAISMLVVILISCVVLIYRFITKKSYPEGTSSGVSKMIKIATIGVVISLLLAWLLS